MRTKTNWHERYITNHADWDSGREDSNLTEIVNKIPIKPCKVLEVGCGTGSNAIWLARKKFIVTGVDITDLAIQRAKEKTSKVGVSCKFLAADFMKDKIKGAPFEFIFDRGCFHSFNSHKERSKFAENTFSYLKNNGVWLTLVGSKDAPMRNPGPPQRGAKDIISAVEPYFEIISLYSSQFDSNMKNPPKAWVCLMKKRHI